MIINIAASKSHPLSGGEVQDVDTSGGDREWEDNAGDMYQIRCNTKFLQFTVFCSCYDF